MLLSYATKVDYACVPCNNQCYNRRTLCVHILYNQAFVGGLSDRFDPATRIANIQLPGGSIYLDSSPQRGLTKLARKNAGSYR